MLKSLFIALVVAVVTLTDLGSWALVALTDLQFDKILDMLAAGMRAIGEAVKAVWIALAPTLIAYLAWRQHANNKAREKGQEVIKGKVDAVIAETPKASAADAPGSSTQNPVHVELHEGPPA